MVFRQTHQAIHSFIHSFVYKYMIRVKQSQAVSAHRAPVKAHSEYRIPVFVV